jgi:hypothetical protein
MLVDVISYAERKATLIVSQARKQNAVRAALDVGH